MNKTVLLSPECLIDGDLLDGLWYRRTECLRRGYSDMKENGIDGVNFDNLELSPFLVGRVVDHYMGDYQVLRLRYGITDNIQLHRVAGLFASAICRYRPILIKASKPTHQEASINEHFALHVSLSICGQHTAGKGGTPFVKNPLIIGWAKRFKYLLGSRNYTPEGLAMVFETLCIEHCPENFTSDPAYQEALAGAGSTAA